MAESEKCPQALESSDMSVPAGTSRFQTVIFSHRGYSQGLKALPRFPLP